MDELKHSVLRDDDSEHDTNLIRKKIILDSVVFFLYHWFVYSISVCFVIKRWQWLHRMMWHFSRVTVRVQHKSVQTHKTTNRSINRFVYQIHQVVTQKKADRTIKKDNIHAIPSWGFFYMSNIKHTDESKDKWWKRFISSRCDLIGCNL